MMVCLCKAVSDRDVRKAIAAGARTVAEVGASCGAGTDCGACRPAIADLLVDARTLVRRPRAASAPALPALVAAAAAAR